MCSLGIAVFAPLTCRSGNLFRDLGLAGVDWVRDRLSNSYCRYFIRPCGSRPTGEVLFCYSQKEYPEKAATTLVAPAKSVGVPIVVVRLPCCEKTHPRWKARVLRQFSQKTHDNRTTTMARLRWKVSQKKRTKPRNKKPETKTDFEFVGLHKARCRQ